MAWNAPSVVRVRVDRHQGRLVLPRGMREDIVAIPGEVLLRRTSDGLLLTPAGATGELGEGPDGLPVLVLGRQVTNDETLAGIQQDRAGR